MRQMSLAIQTRPVNVVEVDSFEQLFIPGVEELTTCREWIRVTCAFPMGVDFGVNKVVVHHKFNLAVL